MEIKPINKVRLIKGVPFSIDYKDIIQFDNVAAQETYFNSLPYIEFDKLTYVRHNGVIKVKANRESLLDYNYMSFQNLNYGNKTFYAFITGITYINPNTTAVSFTIDEWQTWQFDLTFKPSFIERKHCKRWNTDGTPVINTVPETLEYGSEYITKDHQQYNNNLYWVCYVTSLQSNTGVQSGVPDILQRYYLPMYKTTNNWISSYQLNNSTGGKTGNSHASMLSIFRNSSNLVNKLVSAFIVEDPPFNYSYTILGTTIMITSNDLTYQEIRAKNDEASTIDVPVYDIYTFPVYTNTKSNPNSVIRTYPKYGALTSNITESKLLMYPYSYVQLVDGQGNNFVIKPEYLTSNNIQIQTFTSNGLNSKQAHIVQNYRYKSGLGLGNCRWELQNGIINNNVNNLTIIDDYTAAYLQGNANQVQQSLAATQQQSALNNLMAQNTADANFVAAGLAGVSNIGSSLGEGAGELQASEILGNNTEATGSVMSGNIAGNIVRSLGGLGAAAIQGSTYIRNTELQGALTNEKAQAAALAKVQDAQMVADNVSLQGGDVFFTFQNQFNGYCLVYRQISDEYINILTNYFQKYGYAYNRVEIPNLHTRESWDYIRCVDVKIFASINEESLLKIHAIFNNGTTIWHTTDVGNYNLPNNEI